MTDYSKGAAKRFYCCHKRCRWMIPAEAEGYYPDWDDCTDMTDEEFLEYVKKDIQ